MRHYSLIPVRYNDQQLLVRCAPVDAELWSIQWHSNTWISNDGENWTTNTRKHWFADVSPLEYETASALVQWLNQRETVLNATPIREESP